MAPSRGPDGDGRRDPGGGRLTAALNLSRLAVSRFWERIKRRMPANGHKQFVRYSVAYGGDLDATLPQLQRFGSEWLATQPLAKQGRSD